MVRSESVFMRIIAGILHVESGRTITVEKEGGKVMVLLDFLAAIRKYAEKEYKVQQLATDDEKVYEELTQKYPEMKVTFIEDAATEAAGGEKAIGD